MKFALHSDYCIVLFRMQSPERTAY